jgi:hypothetical protein
MPNVRLGVSVRITVRDLDSCFAGISSEPKFATSLFTEIKPDGFCRAFITA